MAAFHTRAAQDYRTVIRGAKFVITRGDAKTAAGLRAVQYAQFYLWKQGFEFRFDFHFVQLEIFNSAELQYSKTIPYL